MQKVSIIIPVFNGEKYIKAAIDSALAQDYPDFEVIVINDGSTDNTKNILMQYVGDSRLKIAGKDNGGTASALNLGIQMAKGEWIKWLSADDVMFPHYLKTVFEEVNTTEFPEACIFYTSFGCIDEKGNQVGLEIEQDRNNLTDYMRHQTILDKFYGNGSSSFIHKYVFQEVGLFDETLPYSEDYDFWLRAVCLHNIRLHLVPQVLISYRLHDEQISRKVNGSIDFYLRDKTRAAIYSMHRGPVNILLARGSPRDLPDVTAHWPNMSHDMIIAKWIREWDAYQHMLKYFKDNPQYTHIAVAADDIVVRPEHLEQLQKTLERIDYPILTGVMNVEEDDLDTLAITPPDNVPHMLWTKRNFNWLKDSQLEKKIMRVGFSGFPLMVIRRDIALQFGFDSDGTDNGYNQENTGSLDVVVGWKAHSKNIPIYADVSCNMLHQRRRQAHVRDEEKAHLIFWPAKGTPINLRGKHLRPINGK